MLFNKYLFDFVVVNEVQLLGMLFNVYRSKGEKILSELGMDGLITRGIKSQARVYIMKVDCQLKGQLNARPSSLGCIKKTVESPIPGF